MIINEATSAASSKLNEFIAHIPDAEQKNIKNVLNGVYLFLKNNNFPYEEISKPNKSPYHGTFTKISGSRELDQLSWKLKVSVPLNYGNNKKPVYQFSQELQSEIKSIARKENGSYFYDSTNKDLYDSVGFNKDILVEIGRHTDGTGVYYDHNNNIVKIVLVVKVVVKRFVEDKSKVDTSDNHKAIISKVSSFISPSDKSKTLKAIETIYTHLDKIYGGCIETKRVMTKEVDLDTRKFAYEDKDKILPCRALVWKTELKNTSTMYGVFKEKELVESYSLEDVIFLNVDNNNYTVGKTGDESYVGVSHQYGSRSTEYAYFIVLKPDMNPMQITGNPFLSKDGKSLKNKHVSVTYDRNKKEIFGADLEDMANMPRFYTTKKQGIDKAWADLIDAFDEDTDDSKCMRIIGYDKVHSYCGMD